MGVIIWALTSFAIILCIVVWLDTAKKTIQRLHQTVMEAFNQYIFYVNLSTENEYYNDCKTSDLVQLSEKIYNQSISNYNNTLSKYQFLIPAVIFRLPLSHKDIAHISIQSMR